MKLSGKIRKTGFLSLLLSLIGFSTVSCWGPVMYGAPTGTWSVKGKVMDETGKPIPGLQVILAERLDDEAGTMDESNYYPLDTLKTGGDGIYQTEDCGLLNKLQIDVKDIDGEANVGEFADVTLLIGDITYRNGDGNFDFGHAEIIVPDIILKKK